MRSTLFHVCFLIFVAYISAEGEESSTSESTPKSIESSTEAQSASTPTVTASEYSSTTTGNTSTNFMCAVCRSDNTAQSSCGSDVGDKFNTQCTLQPGKNETLNACYIWKTGEFLGFGFLKLMLSSSDKNVIVRDCYTTAVALGLNISGIACADTANQCVFCTGTNCNIGKAPGSAVSLKVSGALIVISMLFVSKYL